MKPDNLPLVVPINDAQAAIIERIYKGQELPLNLIQITQWWYVRVWFNQEYMFKTRLRHTIEPLPSNDPRGFTKRIVRTDSERSDNHVFHKVFKSWAGNLCYSVTWGYHTRLKRYLFPNLDTITKYEFVLNKKGHSTI